MYMERTALVVGASGIAGYAASRRLLEDGWRVLGLSRRGVGLANGVESIRADLLDAAGLDEALRGHAPEVVIITAWMRQDSEAANIEVNTALLRNLFEALSERPPRHVALLTGLKHYLGPFEDYASGARAETPFHEDEPRLSSPNFYYAQEDELFAAASRMHFTWSVHRAHTIFGHAVDNAMNMVLTLSVYAEICRELDQAFVFPGSVQQWNFVTDVTDADLLGEHLVWASTHPEGVDEPFNIANGDLFRWRWLWPRLASLFGVIPVGPGEVPATLVDSMTEIAPSVWRRIAERWGLIEPDVTRLVSWWHSDSDLGREVECFTDMTKSRVAGFTGFRVTTDSLEATVERYRQAGILPRR